MKTYLKTLYWIIAALLMPLGFMLVGTAAYAVGCMLIPLRIRKLAVI